MISKSGVTDNVAALESAPSSGNAAIANPEAIDDLFLYDDDTPDEFTEAAVDFDEKACAVTPRVLERILRQYKSDDSNLPVMPSAIYRDMTAEYLAAIPQAFAHRVEPAQVTRDLVNLGSRLIALQNSKLPKGDTKFTKPQELTCAQIAACMLHLCKIVCITPPKGDQDREYDIVAMYETDGDRAGTYTPSEEARRLTARRFKENLTLADMREVEAILHERAPRRTRAVDRDLVAVNNGIFFFGSEDRDIDVDGETIRFQAKSLHPFDSRVIFMTKSRIDYVENAPNPTIAHADGTVWDVESWITDLFMYDTSTASDPAELAEMIEKNQRNAGLDELVWEILSAIVRPYVPWGKTSWFYSTVGNNGKGTLCALARNLLGHGAHTSIPLSELGKEFALEPLLNVNAVIVDENDVGGFIDKAANLKAIVTNDVFAINRKHRVSLAFQFWGHMIQCLNELPRMKDKSESNYRRQLFVPFEKSFTGRERKYIKNDYLERPEVLQYVLSRVLHMTHYELSEPAATKRVLAEYKEYNDPVRAFWSEFRDQFCWDLVPFTFLYDLFKAWHMRTTPSGVSVRNQDFVNNIVGLLDNDPVWHCPDKTTKIRPAQKMNFPEPLIAEYELTQWMRAGAKPGDPTALRPDLKPNYRGILRRANAIATVTAITTESDTEELAA